MFSGRLIGRRLGGWLLRRRGYGLVMLIRMRIGIILLIWVILNPL